MAKSTRRFFEPRFEHDLSQVRVHTDSQAAETVKGINARAFTVGRDIVFSISQYSSGITSCRQLLAHKERCFFT